MRNPVPPCAVCTRLSRGYGWCDIYKRKNPRPSVLFCSMPCQAFWSVTARRSTAMVDLTEQEEAAVRVAIQPVAEIMNEIGWTTRFQDLTEQQVVTLLHVAVGGFRDAMQAIARGEPTEEVPF